MPPPYILGALSHLGRKLTQTYSQANKVDNASLEDPNGALDVPPPQHDVSITGLGRLKYMATQQKFGAFPQPAPWPHASLPSEMPAQLPSWPMKPVDPVDDPQAVFNVGMDSVSTSDPLQDNPPDKEQTTLSGVHLARLQKGSHPELDPSSAALKDYETLDAAANIVPDNFVDVELVEYDKTAIIGKGSIQSRMAHAKQQVADTEEVLKKFIPLEAPVRHVDRMRHELRAFLEASGKTQAKIMEASGKTPAEVKKASDKTQTEIKKTIDIAAEVYNTARHAQEQVINRHPYTRMPCIFAGLTPTVNNPSMHDVAGYTNEFTNGAVFMPCKDWSPEINDMWVYGAIKGGAAIAFVSAYVSDDFLTSYADNTDPEAPDYGHTRISTREIAGALAAGYVVANSDQFGTVLIPGKDFDPEQFTYGKYRELIAKTNVKATLELAAGKPGAFGNYFMEAIGQNDKDAVDTLRKTAEEMTKDGTSGTSPQAKVERLHKMYVTARGILNGQIPNLPHDAHAPFNEDPAKQAELVARAMAGDAACKLVEQKAGIALGDDDRLAVRITVEEALAEGRFDLEKVNGKDTLVAFLEGLAEQVKPEATVSDDPDAEMEDVD